MAYPKMDKAIKKAWVAELRSGDYEQGKFALRADADKFCCLGVLCNVHAKYTPEVAKTQKNPEAYDRHSGHPSPMVLAWADLSADVAKKLVKMNDHEKKTFKEIADWIVKNV